MNLPEYLKHGREARLFPPLANNKKEERATSILLSCLKYIDEFSDGLFNTIGQSVNGKRTNLRTYTEVVFKNDPDGKSRPDGLIIIERSGGKNWTAIIETKIGDECLSEEQIERYIHLAKNNKIDAIITISNEFSHDPMVHPIDKFTKSKVPVFHWSWRQILTTADILVDNDEIKDKEQGFILKDLFYFLNHPSTGVKGFDQMPPEWKDVSEKVSAGHVFNKNSTEIRTVIDAWHQEVRDLQLQLSRITNTNVQQNLSRKHKSEPQERFRDECDLLINSHKVVASYLISDTAAPLNIEMCFLRKTLEISMEIQSPEDRQKSSACFNWLNRQLVKNREEIEKRNIWIKCHFPRTKNSPMFKYNELIQDPRVLDSEKQGIKTSSFSIIYSIDLGNKFAQVRNVISEIEKLVPDFYTEIGQHLQQWVKPAPKVSDTSNKITEEIIN